MRSSATFHEEASMDYDAAFDWYLARSADAALKFDAEIDHALTLITAAPERWLVGPFGTRRFILRKFPFILFYREQPRGNIQVVAVAHTSRKPRYWKQRL